MPAALATTFDGATPKWRKPSAPAPSANQQRVERLRAAVPLLAERDRRFAGDLVAQWDERKYLSDRQWPWVDTLTQRAAELDAKPQPVLQRGLDKVVAMMDKAAQRLQFPTVRFMVDGLELKLTRNGAQSKAPGAVAVCSGRGGFGDRTYFGRVDRDGTWQPSAAGAKVEGLYEALLAMDENMAAVAKQYGKLLGSCCFCATELTNDGSIQVGYGPICAGRYGLPHPLNR